MGIRSTVQRELIFENCKITDVNITEEKVVVTTEHQQIFEAALIIGCDGAHSVVSKKTTDTKMDHGHYSAAVRAYYENVEGGHGGAALTSC